LCANAERTRVLHEAIDPDGTRRYVVHGVQHTPARLVTACSVAAGPAPVDHRKVAD
jgi:hypothetical protein